MASKPVAVGSPAPDFTATAVVDGRFKEISLNAYTTANHWVALVFFPRAWSFICPTEIKAFSARLEDFLYSRSCAVAFISTDSQYCLKAWNNTGELEGGLDGVHAPLISDSSHKICRAYNVLNEDQGVAERTLFIIDPKGIIRNITMNDIDVGRSVDETLRIIDALAFKDSYGEGCPANWQKGDKGLDISTQTKVDGPIDIIPNKKSWGEWVRPKLQRAYSSTSQRSSLMLPSISSSSRTPDLINFPPPPPSPTFSPTSAAQYFMEKNMDAAMKNLGVGTAN